VGKTALSARTTLRAALREPLVHFLLAGAVIFAVFSNVAPDPGERRIVVDEAQVTRLVDRWVASYQRAPSPEEVDGLIREYVADQVYYREALRLGLDRDDEVVMRRMRNKMESLATANAEAATPTDASLQALIDRDPARYAGDPSYDFAQVYLGEDTPANRAAAATTLKSLQGGADLARMGQPAALPARLTAASRSAIAEQFGDGFAAALATLPQERWTGPVVSGFGLHLVRVTKVVAPPPPTLASVRRQVENDWRADAVRTAREKTFRALLEGYDVVIEKPR
jgi:hypothetical protein